MITPTPGQPDNIQAMVHALSKYGVCVDTSFTGAGKTYMVLFVAEWLDMDLAVVTSKASIPDWEDVAMEMNIKLHYCVNYEALLARNRQSHVDKRTGKRTQRGVNLKHHPDPHPMGGWTHVNREWKWNIPRNTILVFDEAHRMGGMTNKNVRFLKAAKDQKIPTIAMSATLADSPLRMRGVAYLTGILRGFSTVKFKAWCLLHGCDYVDTHKLEFMGDSESEMEAIRKEMGAQVTGLVRSQVPGLPESRLILRSVNVKGVPDDIYADALIELAETAGTEGTAALRARQLAEWRKRDAMVELAKELMEDGYAVCIFVSFVKTGQWLAKKLKSDFVCGDLEKFRESQISKFQNNETDILVLMIDAGGESINLHDLHGKPRATIVSPNHKATQFVQCLGRTPRTKSKQAVVPQHILFARGSQVEQRIKQNLRGKMDRISSITKNDLALQDFSTQTATMPIHNPEPETRVDKADHSLVSPSKLKYLDLCPHFRQDEDKTPHPNTVDGNIVHLLAELYFAPEREKSLSPEEQTLYDQATEDHVQRALKACRFADKEIEKHFS